VPTENYGTREFLKNDFNIDPESSPGERRDSFYSNLTEDRQLNQKAATP